MRRRRRANFAGFALGLLLVAGVALAAWLNAPIGPPTRTSGVIESIQLISRGCPCATVSVDGHRAILRSATLRVCQVGDRIPLDRRKAPIGFRYSFPPGSCRWR